MTLLPTNNKKVKIKFVNNIETNSKRNVYVKNCKKKLMEVMADRAFFREEGESSTSQDERMSKGQCCMMKHNR